MVKKNILLVLHFVIFVNRLVQFSTAYPCTSLNTHGIRDILTNCLQDRQQYTVVEGYKSEI